MWFNLDSLPKRRALLCAPFVCNVLDTNNDIIRCYFPKYATKILTFEAILVPLLSYLYVLQKIHMHSLAYLNQHKGLVFTSSSVYINTRIWGVSNSYFYRCFGNHMKLLDSYLCEFMRHKRLPQEANLLKRYCRAFLNIYSIFISECVLNIHTFTHI